MRYSCTALALAALAIGQAAAQPSRHSHEHFHAKKDAAPSMAEVGIEKRSTTLSSQDLMALSSFQLKAPPMNEVSNNGQVWIGTDGPYTNTFTNNAGVNLILVCWGPEGSWVNRVTPLIGVSLTPGDSTTLSFANGASGGCSAVYPDTQPANGQISNTWVEYTFGEYGVVDVSREVNMNGHGVSVVGPACTTDMDTCVFTCLPDNPTSSCWQTYQLVNCATGSQPGANYGMYAGMPSGGCGGMGSSAKLQTSLY